MVNDWLFPDPGRTRMSRPSGVYARCSASGTPLSVSAMAATSRKPNGSPRMKAAETTPITGTSSMPVEAEVGGRRQAGQGLEPGEIAQPHRHQHHIDETGNAFGRDRRIIRVLEGDAEHEHHEAAEPD